VQLEAVIPQSLFTTSSPTFAGLTVGSSTAILKRVSGVLTDAISGVDYQAAGSTYLTGSLTATRIPVASGAQTLIDYAALTADGSGNIISTAYATFDSGLGIGTAPTASIPLYIVKTVSSSSVAIGIASTFTNTATSASPSTGPTTKSLNFGTLYQPTLTASKDWTGTNFIAGAEGNCELLTNASEIYNLTFPSAYGIRAYVNCTRGAGSTSSLIITNGFCYNAYPSQAVNGGVITNLTAFYDAGQTVGLNNWGIIINSPKNKIAGDLQVRSFISSDPTVLDTEKITNGGTFTSGWTYTTPSWTLTAGKMVKGSDGVDTLVQTSAAMVTPLVIGEVYRLSYLMSSHSVGYVTPTCAGVTLDSCSANGTVTCIFVATSTADLVFTPSNTSRFSLDDISLRKITGGSTYTCGTKGVQGTLIVQGNSRLGAVTAPVYACDVTGDVNCTGAFRSGGTAGINATVTYVDTLLGAKTLTFTKGILTAQV
jgi:hypothetical protein